jgi:hypothetical protein
MVVYPAKFPKSAIVTDCKLCGNTGMVKANDVRSVESFVKGKAKRRICPNCLGLSSRIK